jgi:two-component system, NtrC family, sensor kinase
MMKKINLALFLLFISNLGFAQVFTIDSLPNNGIILDKGWKWYAGDNPVFAQPDFDDSAWEGIDPTKDIFDLPQLNKKTGEIGWFRLKMNLNKNISKNLVMDLIQSGASEFYLNGVLLKKFGRVSHKPEDIIAFIPRNSPQEFLLSDKEENVLAVRYVLEPNIRYGNHFGTQNLAIKIRLNSFDNTLSKYTGLFDNAFGSYLYMGAFGVLAFLFLTYYLFASKRKESLYFSIFCFSMLPTWYYFISAHLATPVKYLFYLNNQLLVFQSIGYWFFLYSIYTLFKRKKGLVFWIITTFIIVAIMAGSFLYGWYWMLFGVGVVWIVNIEFTRLCFVEVRNSQKGAWIMLLGGIIYVVCWIIFQISFLGIYPNSFAQTAFEVSYLIVPFAFAIYYGYDFGMTNRSLQQKLIENEKLASEKQQILATQNDTLELQVKERTSELIATQNQLIQKEKLASLGELTAGIAHEIQNPLNFVNNFSELSVGIAEDLKEELQRTDLDKKYIDELLTDLSTNQEKINHHGKRASSIVKGMLEHSRASTGERALTDINALCDEYLRLSYHGMRAMDKDFNADFKTDFDENLPKTMVIPQDLGRVLLNLINNAFYAVHERNLQGLENLAGFTPMVSISTKTLDNFIEIKVKDNGNGIPKENLEKIFQPFFTTKPTGEGTGLGLSLAYDIVTKGHGGILEVVSTEGVGSEFIITYPFITI